MTINGFRFNIYGYERVKIKKLPKKSGVYVLFSQTDGKKKILYIGSTTNLLKRITTHAVYRKLKKEIHKECLFIGFCFLDMGWKILEKELINDKNPPHNIWVNKKFKKHVV